MKVGSSEQPVGGIGLSEPGFIVNFLRDRDSYVVPRALAADDRLVKLVTDIYFTKGPSWRKSILRGIADHHSREVDPKYVEECLAAAAIQFIGGRGLSRILDTNYIANRILARKTAKVWKRQPADLLLYSGYARDAFRAARGSSSLKLLFLYHPHYKIISDLLRIDAERFPESAKAQRSDREITTWWRWNFADEEIELADGVVTASNFSSHSLVHAGFRKPTAIVPYFSKLRSEEFDLDTKNGNRCRFLFVGQGVVRKGIHHLFRAWSEAKLKDAELTCVCSSLDPHLASLMPDDVILKSRLSYSELRQEYARSHVFVMPSLVEGFGLVYNEARSYGNFVIYTPNTGGPDMSFDATTGKMVSAGDVTDLKHGLIESNNLFQKRELDFAQIARSAHRGDWQSYVRQLNRACDSLRMNTKKLSR